MKINIKKFFTVAAAASVLTACIGDLNTLPLNESDVTSETAYGNDPQGYIQGLTKIYFQLVSNSTQNLISGLDGGASEFIRAFWSTQEVTADAVKCAWRDPWVNDLNKGTWKGDVTNDAVYSVYVRTLQSVAYVNEYLRQTAPAALESRGVSAELAAAIEGYRAEARFLRAYFYWAAMDTFGQVPFSTEDSPFGGGYVPAQKPAAEIFQYCVSELEYLASAESAMPAAQSNYPRADKGSCLGLLARLYLNAEVYTGKAMWAEAKTTCERIYALGYALAPTHAELFRGDNGENPDARKEFLFAAAYDAENTQSYGGTSYLTLSTLNGNDGSTLLNGVNGGWAGNRVPYGYVQNFFKDVQNPDYTAGTYDYTDLRASYFHIKDREESMEGEFGLSTFLCGWSCIKYNNIPHDKTAAEFEATAKIKSFSDIDFPLIRLGEIHLIYAEACMHVGGSAAEQLNALTARANASAPSTVTEEWLMAERARELMWEGHRRTDLIRYNKWISGYDWTYKGGVFEGTDFPSHFNLFPVPYIELTANLELNQNPGYKGR